MGFCRPWAPCLRRKLGCRVCRPALDAGLGRSERGSRPSSTACCPLPPWRSVPGPEGQQACSPGDGRVNRRKAQSGFCWCWAGGLGPVPFLRRGWSHPRGLPGHPSSVGFCFPVPLPVVPPIRAPVAAHCSEPRLRSPFPGSLSALGTAPDGWWDRQPRVPCRASWGLRCRLGQGGRGGLVLSGGDCLCCPSEGFRPGPRWHADALLFSGGPGTGLQTTGLWLRGPRALGSVLECGGCPSPRAQGPAREGGRRCIWRDGGAPGPPRATPLSLTQGALLGEGPAVGSWLGRQGGAVTLSRRGRAAELRAWAIEPSGGDKGQSLEPRDGRTLCDPEGLVLGSPLSPTQPPCALPRVPPPPEAE